MFRSRGKSRSRTPTPTSTPTASDESFIRKKFSTLHRGDLKTLAASSIAVASSIGSPSLNYPPRSDEQTATHTSDPDSDRDAIGEESFPPGPSPPELRNPASEYELQPKESSSCRAAESAWQITYSTARMVVNIAKESSDMFLPLKTVVGALSFLIKNHDQTMSNARQIEEIEKRVLSLSDILRFPLRDDDHSERARRELLSRRLMEVLEKLEPLSEQNGLLRFLQNEDHAGLLNGFVQDISRAVTDYQTSLQQCMYKNTRDTHEVSRNIDQTTKGIAENTTDIVHKAKEIIEAAGLETLDKLDPVRSAGYQAGHHERCLTGTRESILADIMAWAQNPQDQPVYWLNGLAGTGKSTIAQTFSEMVSNREILGASFFCSRDYLDRKVLKNIFPTLAYQLACRYPQFRDYLVNVIKQDPSVAHNSLISQLRDLLADPLSSTGISCVIVIDALDECVDDQPASAILSVLGRLVNKLPRVKFFITGRPEPRIRSGFRLPLLEPFTQVFLLHEVDPTSVGGDIRLYLTEKLTAIVKRRSDLDLPEAWPSDEDITVLVKKSSGLFIFASTVTRFIESEHHDPRERLRLIVSKADDTSHEGASGIDSLYSQVLHDAFFGIEDESVFDDLKRILSAVVLALNPLSRDGLAQLLNIDSAVISTRLRHLHSVLLVPADEAKEIRVFHKSFPDFLQDPDRCRDSRFHIDCSTRHGDMALGCLGLMGKLEKNPCALPPFFMNRDVADRPQLLTDKLGSGLRYACEYWSTHLSFSPPSGEYHNWLIASTSLFFNHVLFPWMEVMSLEDHLEGVIHSMNHLLDWLGKAGIADGPLHDLSTDCLRFTLHFFRPIQASAQHVYHTALPLSPESSILRSRFFESNPSWEKVLTTRRASFPRIPDTWGQILRTIKADSGSFTHVTVAGRRIAAVCEDNTVNVYDAVTGVLRFSLIAPRKVTKVEGSLNGSALFLAHHHAREITVWDTQTGGLIRTLTTTSEINDIAISLKGKYLGSCSSDGNFRFWEVESGHEGSHFLGQPAVCMCWLEPEDRVALALKGVVTILEVTTGKTVGTFCSGEGVRGITFSAGRRRLGIFSTVRNVTTIAIIDIRTGKVLVSPPSLMHASCLTFSGDGDRVICATKTGDLRSFHIAGTSSKWHDRLSNLGKIHSLSLLRSGHLVVNVGRSIQLLEMEYARSSSTSLGRKMVCLSRLSDDKTICASSGDHEDTNLLDVETMKSFSKFCRGHHEYIISSTLPLHCASLDRDITVVCVQTHNRFTLVLDVFSPSLRLCDPYHSFIRWEKPLFGPVLLGALSPDNEKLITVSGGEGPSGGGDWELHVQGVSNGKILTPFPFVRGGRPPSNIVFTSETQFYTEDRRMNPCIRRSVIRRPDDMEILTTNPEGQIRIKVLHKVYCVRKTFVLTGVGSHLRIEEVSEEEVLEEEMLEEEVLVTDPYTLDENLEWVLDAESMRVCWLPPGYVTETKNGHLSIGSSIIMAGQDGVVRKLTFRNRSSDS